MKKTYVATRSTAQILKMVVLPLTVFSITQQSFGQHILTPQVISTTGGFSTSATISQSYTVGQSTMVQTLSANNSMLTQGFQQPVENITGLLEVSKTDIGSFVVYPNPAVDNLWFGFDFSVSGKVTVEMLDMSGQKLASVYNNDDVNGKIIQKMDVTSYAAGIYILTLNYINSVTGKVATITRKVEVIK